MSPKTRAIIGWILTGLAGALLLMSAFMKLAGGEEVVKNMAAAGISPGTAKIIGVVEILCTLLFIYPRTGVLGLLLLAAYLGGAIATHVEHGQPIVMPVIVECVIWIAGAIRFPELSSRLLGRKTVSQAAP